MKQKFYSVIGLGFGDEGKGSVVDYLCSQHDSDSTLVVRHSGGHQVGHTVRVDDIIHEFRHFGSGTLRGVPTYWDKQCTVSPIMFTVERDVLAMKGVDPTLFVHPLCPVTTPYDIAYNRYYNNILLGAKQSVGVGFSSTLIRHETLPLYAKDLKYPNVLKAKLKAIKDYYVRKAGSIEVGIAIQEQIETIVELDNFSFEECCETFVENTIPTNRNILSYFENVIFEANQGVLLDKDHGIQPYVTHGKTTNYNLRNFDIGEVEAYYVTRAYSSRHGDGPMFSDERELNLVNTGDESNHYNNNQGNFRVGPLNLDIIDYAIESDKYDYKSKSHNLVVTCMDQFTNVDEIPYIATDKAVTGNVLKAIRATIPSKFRLFFNISSESKTIVEYP